MSADINTDDIQKTLDELDKKFGIINKDLKDYEKNMKRGNTSYKDHLAQIDKLDNHIDSLNENINNAGARAQRSLLLDKKIDSEKAASAARLEEAISKTTSKIVTSAIAGSSAFVRNIQTGASAALLSQNLLNSAVDIAAVGTTAAGDGLQAAGNSAMLSSGKFKVLGAGATILGGVLSSLSPAVAGLAKFGIQFMTTEIEKTTNALKLMSGAGASFGGGLTEMRNLATQSGLGLEDFSLIVSNSRGSISEMGMSASQAAVKLSKGLGQLNANGGKLRDQLSSLGMSYEDQGTAMASYAAMMNSSGQLRYMSDKQLAAGTVQYAKDLKVLTDLTGEDAKKALEAARLKSMEADLLAQAMAKGGPAAVEKLQRQLAIMPEVMKKGYMELVSTGGTAIADAATNVAMTENPKIREQYNQMFQTLGDSNKNASQAQDETAKLNEQTGKYAMAHMEDTKTIGMAGRLTGDAMLSGVSAFNNGLIQTGAKFGEGATEGARVAAEKMAASQDEATKNYVAAIGAINDFKVAMEHLATTMMPKYTALMKLSIETTSAMIQKALRIAGGETPEHTTGENAMHIGGKALEYGAYGAMVGSVFPGAGNVIGAGIGAVAGAAMGTYDAFSSKGYAKGGISSGPVSGYTEKLHGTEAVVPLPDGRSIPVTLDSSSITNSINQQNSILNSILDTLQKTNHLTDDILQQAY